MPLDLTPESLVRRLSATLIRLRRTRSARKARGGTLVLLCLVAPSASVLPAQIGQSEFAARRAALTAALPDGVLLVLGGREPTPDFVPFQQQPQFRYLTGFHEPGSALLIVKARPRRSRSWRFAPRGWGLESAGSRPVIPSGTTS